MNNFCEMGDEVRSCLPQFSVPIRKLRTGDNISTPNVNRIIRKIYYTKLKSKYSLMGDICPNGLRPHIYISKPSGEFLICNQVCLKEPISGVLQL